MSEKKLDVVRDMLTAQMKRIMDAPLYRIDAEIERSSAIASLGKAFAANESAALQKIIAEGLCEFIKAASEIGIEYIDGKKGDK